MRDDLHRSLPLARPWKAVVKAAQAPDINGRLVDAMTRAYWSSADWFKSPWGREFVTLLDNAQPDMFGIERVDCALEQLEHGAPNHYARRACEVARGYLVESAFAGDLARTVLKAVMQEQLCNHIEQAMSAARELYPRENLSLIRARMERAAEQCDPLGPPAKRRRPKPSVDAALSLSLPVTF